MKYTPEMRAAVAKEARGKTIETMEWEEERDGDPGYWVITFTDGTEISVLLMAEQQPLIDPSEAAKTPPTKPWDEGGRDEYFSKLPGDERLVAGEHCSSCWSAPGTGHDPDCNRSSKPAPPQQPAERVVRRWAPVQEKMPKDGSLVALLTPDGRVLGYRVIEGKFYREGFAPYPLHEPEALACRWVELPIPDEKGQA